MTKKYPVIILATLMGLVAARPLSAQETHPGPENVYDVLGKALRPLGNVFAANDDGQPGAHGMVLDAHMVQTSGTAGPDEIPAPVGEVSGTGTAVGKFQPQSVHVALMTPDALLVQAPIGGEVFSVCRDGDSLWATPGSKIQALLDAAADKAAGKKKKKPKVDGEKLLGPLALPVRQREMAFLPLLFQAADAGTADVAGIPCRVIDAQIMPQLSKSLRGWTARLWIGPDYAIRQITVQGPKWSGTLAIDKLEFPPELPEATFQPGGSDVMRLSGRQFLDLLGRVGK